MSVHFINKTSQKLPEELICECVKETVISSEEDGQDFSCTVIAVSASDIKELNSKYREKDSATDVLSFSFEPEAPAPDEPKEEYRGEIVICPEFIKENTEEDKLEWEFCHVATHGTFHLLGVHHEELPGGHEEIHRKEVKIINKILSKKNNQ